MKIVFVLRNEGGLHCRFCNNVYESTFRIPKIINLYETSPIKGIVCENCKVHLKKYLNPKSDSCKDYKNGVCNLKGYKGKKCIKNLCIYYKGDLRL